MTPNAMLPSKRYGAALVAIWLVAAFPIAAADLMPLVDYPSHLARVHILAHWDELTGYEKFYRPAWGILPNLGVDLISIPLATVLPTEIAMRVFCVLLVGLLVWGGALLSRSVCERWTVWSLSPVLLVYNYILAFGFLSFLLGLGIALCALALHIHSRQQRLTKRILREFAFMLALFISHFVALVVYVIAAAAFDALSTVAERHQWRKLAVDYAVLGVAVAMPMLLLLLSPTAESVSRVEFSDLGWKVSKFAQSFETGQGAWDLVFAIAMGVALAALIARGYLRVAPVMAGVTTVLFVVFALAPYRLNTASNLDTRLPIVVLFAAVAALDPRAPLTRPVLTILLALFLFRIATTTVHYRRSSAELEHVEADLAAVPAGSLLFTARQAGAPVWSPHDWHPPRPHATDLLLLSKPFFSSTLFTNPTQQPLVRSPAFTSLGLPPEIGDASQTELEAYGERMIARLSRAGRTEPTYVYVMKGTTPAARTTRFEVVVDRPAYAIYRLVR